MPAKDEDLALVSMLASNAADVMPYFRLPYLTDLFPVRASAIKWVLDYWEQNRALPKVALLKKHHPKVQTLIAAEPLPYCFQELRRQYIDTVAANIGEKMRDAQDQNKIDDFLKFSQKLVDAVSQAQRPLSASADDPTLFVEQLGLELDRNSTTALKIMPTGMKPIDDEDGGGLRPGHIYTLASLVNLGKTYVSLQIADNVRRAGFRVLYISTEMPADDLKLRALAVRYNLNVDEIISRKQPQASIAIPETREAWYKGYLQKLQSLIDADASPGKVFIRGCDGGVLTPQQIAADVKELGIDAVFIDAAQDIRDNQLTKERTPALYNAVQQLNDLVKELKVSLFVTVQLDPEVEKKGLTQGNLNRIQWAQVFAQKSHVLISMLGKRDADFRDMSIDKSRDGKAGRKFWLIFRFPEVKIESSTKPPGTLDDLDPNATKPAETVAELDAALSAIAAEEENAAAAAPPVPMINTPPPTAAKTPPTRANAGPAPSDPSPYAERQRLKSLKKFKRR